MNRNTLLSILATAAFGIVMAGPVSATDFVWDGGGNNDNWSNPDNWTADSGYPDDNGDKATLRGDTGPTLDVNVTIGELVIEDDAALKVHVAMGTRVLTLDDGDETLTGKLTIEAGGKLNIHGNGQVILDGTTPHLIRGDVNLIKNGAIGAVLKFADSVTVNGTGNIVGQDDRAELRIAAGKVLTNTTSIVGRMTIVGETGPGNAGKLDNRGLVHANASGGGTLALDSNLIVVDTSGNRWKVDTHSGNVLQFAGGIPCGDLTGNFDLDGCATLQFDGDVYTSGSFTAGDGFIDVVGGTFNYGCNPDCSSCTTVNSDTSYGSCG